LAIAIFATAELLAEKKRIWCRMSLVRFS